jgi:hypothetical protein
MGDTHTQMHTLLMIVIVIDGILQVSRGAGVGIWNGGRGSESLPRTVKWRKQSGLRLTAN